MHYRIEKYFTEGGKVLKKIEPTAIEASKEEAVRKSPRTGEECEQAHMNTFYLYSSILLVVICYGAQAIYYWETCRFLVLLYLIPIVGYSLVAWILFTKVFV